MIRILLGTDDLERVQIADSPDFGYELALGGAVLANRTRASHLSQWRREVARNWNPSYSRLFDLYTPAHLPTFSGLAARPAQAAPAHPAIDPDSTGTALHVRDLARARALTPFTTALADGHPPAYRALGQLISGFQAIALDPFRRRITSVVHTASAQAGTRAATSGIDAMLRTLHPMLHWDGSVLALNTIHDCHEPLEGRPLVLQPSALAIGISINPAADSVTITYPATNVVLARDPASRAPSLALAALLGSTRAAALAAVVEAPALTTGELAAVLGLSAAAASRQATALREAGLIATFRNTQTVHHHPTRLGMDLLSGSDDARDW
ncbi:MarR family transcriptional regulator [Streptomyces mauvecolor]|uniref:MarR family transcriptional regulator n=1 Tax=Streptomyces mauvecolor TaxID=58345 RepID=A0ABV9UYL4_9ACTN